MNSIRHVFRNNGLSIVLVGIFLSCWLAMTIVGHAACNNDRRDHGQPVIGMTAYLHSGNFIEATTENWESEFLEMAGFAWLTSFLFQKGSPESHDPDDKRALERDARAVRGWKMAVYARSLSLAFMGLFFISFCLHAYGGARAFNQQQIEHGHQPISMIAFVGTPEFWFQSFQNWQSEFLGIFSFVVLSIFLRQQGSPQSKPLNAPHSANK